MKFLYMFLGTLWILVAITLVVPTLGTSILIAIPGILIWNKHKNY